MLDFLCIFFSWDLCPSAWISATRILGSYFDLGHFVKVPYWGNDFAFFCSNDIIWCKLGISNINISFCWPIIKAFWKDVWLLQIFELKIFDPESREMIAVRFPAIRRESGRKWCFCKTYNELLLHNCNFPCSLSMMMTVTLMMTATMRIKDMRTMTVFVKCVYNIKELREKLLWTSIGLSGTCSVYRYSDHDDDNNDDDNNDDDDNNYDDEIDYCWWWHWYWKWWW